MRSPTAVAVAVAAVKAVLAEVVIGGQAIGPSRVLNFGDQVIGGPAIVVGMPTLTWDAYGKGPNSAQIPVFCVTDANAQQAEALWEMVSLTADALDAGTDAVCERAESGLYNAGALQLPSYQITVQYPL